MDGWLVMDGGSYQSREQCPALQFGMLDVF